MNMKLTRAHIGTATRRDAYKSKYCISLFGDKVIGCRTLK